MLTRGRARQSEQTLLSEEESRKIDRCELLSRQSTLRLLLQNSGWLIEVNSRVEIILFDILEMAGPKLAASELAWFLKLLGRDVRKNILRKYVAGERLVKKELSEGIWNHLIIPFITGLGCTISLDGTTFGISADIAGQLFSLVNIDIRGSFILYLLNF